MIFSPPELTKLNKLSDLMQQLFDMPKDSMQIDVTDAGITIKGYSLGSEVILTIKNKTHQ